jgi:hypothetical protein
MKNAVLWEVTAVALVSTNVSEELITSIRVTRIGKVGKMLAVTSKRSTQEFLLSVLLLLVTTNIVPSSPIPPKRRFVQEPHGVTSQKLFFIVTAVKTSSLTQH